MTKILITGANSFVGKNYIINSENKEVKEVCLLKNILTDIDFSKFDTILHVAAIVHQTQQIPEYKYFEVNKDLAINVAKRAKKQGVKQFVFLSTIKVYGEYEPEKGVWYEDSECIPNDSYGKSKYAAEIALKELIDNNFTVSIIRPPLIYGVGVKANMLNIIRLIDKLPILPFGNIKNKRSFTSIENLVQLIDKIIEKRISGVFLAMDSKPLSTTELSKMIAEHMHKRVFLFALPGFLISLGNILFHGIFDRLYGSLEIDNSYTRKVLDFSPKLSTSDGIKNMVHNYLESKK